MHGGVWQLDLPPTAVAGDVLFELFCSADGVADDGSQQGKAAKKEKKVLQAWFNPFFVSGDVLGLPKAEIDKAHKDKKHKLFRSDFQLQFGFVPELSSPADAEIDTVEDETTAAPHAVAATRRQHGQHASDGLPAAAPRVAAPVVCAVSPSRQQFLASLTLTDHTWV